MDTALRMRKFIKGFERQDDGRVLGYNRRMRQDNLGEPWASPSSRFAFFEVRTVDRSARDNRYLRALLLDYGAGGNARADPARFIRDYLVRVDGWLRRSAPRPGVPQIRTIPALADVLRPGGDQLGAVFHQPTGLSERSGRLWGGRFSAEAPLRPSGADQ